jgi:hypothetical protein
MFWNSEAISIEIELTKFINRMWIVNILINPVTMLTIHQYQYCSSFGDDIYTLLLSLLRIPSILFPFCLTGDTTVRFVYYLAIAMNDRFPCAQDSLRSEYNVSDRLGEGWSCISTVSYDTHEYFSFLGCNGSFSTQANFIYTTNFSLYLRVR